jgi:hypothetical protein
MTLKRLTSALATFSILTSSVLGIKILLASTQPMPAVAQSDCNAIRNVNFSGKAASGGVNIRSAPSLSASIVRRSQPNEAFNFEAWTYGDVVNDIWIDQPDARWYKLSGQNAWVASAVVAGNAPGSTPLCNTGQLDFTLPVYREENPFWNAGYAPISTNPPNPKLGNAKGNCTWYANGRTKQLGRNSASVNVMLGNANQWDDQARAAGISLSSTPQVGAIAHWEGSSTNPYGHVAVVEQVNPNGTILISESSYSANSGSSWDFLYRTRTIPANQPSTFILP